MALKLCRAASAGDVNVEAGRLAFEAFARNRGILASDAAALAFRITGPVGRLLYTSRDEQVITTAGARPYRVGALSADAAQFGSSRSA